LPGRRPRAPRDGVGARCRRSRTARNRTAGSRAAVEPPALVPDPGGRADASAGRLTHAAQTEGTRKMIYVVTGTDTDVGKTVVTAALVAAALHRGDRVAVYKPTQTGVLPGQDGDVQNTAKWLGAPDRLSVLEGVRLLEPMAPVDAALEEGG